jgi:hypothetical protein
MMGFPIVRLLLERRSKNDATRLSRGANPGQGTSKQMEQTSTAWRKSHILSLNLSRFVEGRSGQNM